MARLIDAQIQNGELVFINEIPEVPATSETTGNVTVNNMGSPGVIPYFEVSFPTNATYETDGVEKMLFLTPTVIITGKTKDTSFHEVEAEAAREVAPMLRALADHIEKQVMEYDAKQSAKRTDGASA